MGDYNPWRDLRSRPEIVCERVAFDLSDRRLGWSTPGYIALDAGSRRAQLRCTLAHELAHIDLGHHHEWLRDETDPSARRTIAQQEREADEMAARRLVDVAELARCLLVWGANHGAMADELNVDEATLRTRMLCAYRHPAEASYVRRVLVQREAAA